MKTIGVKINLPSDVYYGVKRLLNFNNQQMSELCSALTINRMFDKGYLDEFCNPIELSRLNFNLMLKDYFTNSLSFPDDIKEE